MPIVKREDALRQHAIWHEMGGFRAKVEDHIKPGCVVVCSTGGAKECGFFGSNRISEKNNVETISAAEQQLVGWPLAAAVVERMESMRSCVATFLSASMRAA